MIDFVIASVIVLVIFLASLYVYKSKKSGKNCIGCPYADSCSAKSGKSCCNSNK